MSWTPDNELRDRFARLYAAHYHDLYRYVLTLIPHVQDAQEVLQDTSVALWRKMDSFDPSAAFLPWARQFAYLEALNHRRKYARSRARLSEAVVRLVAEEQAAQQPMLERRFAALNDCLSRLSPDDRRLIEQRYQSEQSIKALAESEGHPADTLYKRLKRLRERLLRCINMKLAEGGGLSDA